REDYIGFTFYVHRKSVPSSITRKNNNIIISFNSIEFYKVLKHSIQQYKTELRISRDLQLKFIRAWKSIEMNVKNIDSDCDRKIEGAYLRNSLRKRPKLNLF